jgi:alpha-ribazole phosphatase
MSRLICVRHGPASAPGICYGRFDVETTIPEASLTTLTLALREAICGKSACLWVSPAERCRKLGRVLSSELSLTEHVDDRITELSFGSWEGRPWTELEQLPEFVHWMKNWKAAAPPGGETLLQLGARVSDWYAALCDFEVHIAVTHAGVIRHLSTSLAGLSWEEALQNPVAHLTLVEFHGGAL